jgi:hypothetical protein
MLYPLSYEGVAGDFNPGDYNIGHRIEGNRA